METLATVPLPARRKIVCGYDFMGRRIKKDVWHGTSSGGWQLHLKLDFIHELGGWNILAERPSGNKDSFLRTYTWGTDLSGDLSGAGGVGGLLFTKLHTSGKTFANGMDLNGNVTLLVDTATGQSAATYDYGPFGEPLRESGEYATLNPFRFSTKYTDDETGLVAYDLRYYRPSTGTWLNRDPIGEIGGINLMSFVENKTVNNIDGLGLARYEYDNQSFHVHATLDNCKLTYTVKFDGNGAASFAAKKGHKLEFDMAKAESHYAAAVTDKDEFSKMKAVIRDR